MHHRRFDRTPCVAFLIAIAAVLSAHLPMARAQEGDKIAQEHIQQLEKIITQLQTTALSSQLRELARETQRLPVGAEAKKKALEHLHQAAMILEKDPGVTDQVFDEMDAYIAALGEGRNGLRAGDELKKCLDECMNSYHEQTSNCRKLKGGIERANCLTRAGNALNNCQNWCIIMNPSPKP